MNRKNKPLVLLSAVLVLLIAAYFVVTALQKSSAEKKAQADADADAVGALSEITSIRASGADTAGLTFQKTDDGWVCTQYDGWPIRQSDAETYVYAYAHLTASRVLTEHGALSEYGLDAPQYVFTVSDGTTEQTLSLSEHDNGRMYAYIGGDDRVFVVGTSLTDYAARDILAWVDYETLPAVSSDEVSALTLTRGGDVWDYTCTQEAADSEDGASETTIIWSAQKNGEPFETVAANVDTALYDLTGLVQAACVDYDPDAASLAAFGFDGSETTLTFTYGDPGTTVTLRVGASVTVDSTVYYYLMLNEDAAVTTVQAATLDELYSLLMSGASADADAQTTAQAAE
ncbi:MAG: DUF4340 domain-containing protein [Oscillospiraceae bacterium]|nr:DUF4340 domain-containing protein [Oscillospiraceae bacterium]